MRAVSGVVGAGAMKERRWWALGLLSVAQFVDVLDVNVVIVALPSIGRELGFSQGELQWVISAYVLLFAGFLLLAGRMADLFGRRRIFVAGLALFTVSSLYCGLAGTPAALIIARAAQGLGAALTVPAALSIITTVFPEGAERNRALAVWTAVAAAGGAAGLVLGGLITDGLGWAWIFFLNVPIGVLALVLAFVLLEESRDPEAPRRLDVAGAVTATAGLILLVYGLVRAEESSFGSPATVGLLVFAAALIGTFVFIERRSVNPLVPLDVFRSRNLTGANLVAFTNTATTAPFGVLLAIYLQGVLGYPATFTGLVFLPFSLAAIAGSFAGSRFTGRFGARAVMYGGLLTVAAASVLTAGISARGGLFYVLSSSVLSGLGLGCSAVASTATGTSAVGGGKRGLASGLLNTAAQVGTALGLAVFVTLAAARADSLAGGGEPTSAALVEGFRWAFFGAAALAVLGAALARLVVREKVAS